MLNPTIESERLVYLEPNDLPAFKCAKVLEGGNPTNITWAPEDLNIAVDLRVVIPTREYKVSSANGISMAFAGNNNGKWSSWFQGTKLKSGKESSSYLTDDYTSVSYQEIVDNKVGSCELLGINSINIIFDSNFYPRVTMTMTDVRGSSLMMPEEQRQLDIDSGAAESDACKNFFNAVFRFPYPRFLLSLKGIYGTFVTFALSVESFKASFNSDSGNFDVTLKFIGEKFGVYTDIPFNFLLIAPYIGATDGTTGKYWQQQLESGRFKYDENGLEGGSILTFKEYLSKYTESSDQMAERLLSDESITALSKLNASIESLDIIEKKVSEFMKLPLAANSKRVDKGNMVLFWTPITDPANKKKNYHVMYDDKAAELFGLIKSFNIDNESYGTNLPNVIVSEFYCTKGDSADEVSVDEETTNLKFYFRAYGDIVKTAPNEGYTVETYGTRDKNARIVTFVEKNQDLFKTGFPDCFRLAMFDATEFFNALPKVKQTLKDSLPKVSEKAAAAVNQCFKDRFGFTPTLENMFRMIYAHLETFMCQIYELIADINGKNRKIKNFKGLTIENTDVYSASGSDAHLPPFPAIYRKSTTMEMMEKIYPGESGSTTAMDEVSFINGIYDGLNEIEQSMSVESEEIPEQPSTTGGVSSTPSGTYTNLYYTFIDVGKTYTGTFGDPVTELLLRTLTAYYENGLKIESGDELNGYISYELSNMLRGKSWNDLGNEKAKQEYFIEKKGSLQKNGAYQPWGKNNFEYNELRVKWERVNGLSIDDVENVKNSSYSFVSNRILEPLTVTKPNHYAWGDREILVFTGKTTEDLIKNLKDDKYSVEDKFFKCFLDKYIGNKYINEGTWGGQEIGDGSRYITNGVTLTNIPYLVRIYSAAYDEKKCSRTLLTDHFSDVKRDYIQSSEDWVKEMWDEFEIFKQKLNTLTTDEAIQLYEMELITKNPYFYSVDFEQKSEVYLPAEIVSSLCTAIDEKISDTEIMNSNSNEPQGDMFQRQTIRTEDEEKGAFYYSLKNLYDRWIPSYTSETFKLPSVADARALKKERFFKSRMANYDNSKFAEYTNFLFVDSVFNDISDKFKVNPDTLAEILLEQFKGHSNLSVLEFISRLCFKNELHLQCMPVFNNFYNADTFADIFTPFSPYDSNSNLGRGVGNTYLVMYTYAASHNLNVKYEKEHGVGYKNDSLSDMLASNNRSFTERALKVFKNKGDGYRVAAFGVTPGMQNQSYFTKISVGMDNPRVTDLEVVNRFRLAEEGRMGGMLQAVGGGQNTFSIYSSKAYDCTLEMPGCMNLMPTMFFQLNNMPMFNGLYRIIKVEHNVQNNTMTTKVTGQRQSIYAIPLSDKSFTMRTLENLFSRTPGALGLVRGETTMMKIGDFYTLNWRGESVGLPNMSSKIVTEYEFDACSMIEQSRKTLKYKDVSCCPKTTYKGHGVCLAMTSAMVSYGLVKKDANGNIIEHHGVIATNSGGWKAADVIPEKFGYGVIATKKDCRIVSGQIYSKSNGEKVNHKCLVYDKAEAGDICIMYSGTGDWLGHACVFDGEEWLSDFNQGNDIWVYNSPDNIKDDNDILIYRFAGKRTKCRV